MQFFRQQSAGCYCSMGRMDTLEGKVQGRCNKIFSLSLRPACRNSPRKNNIQMLFTPGLILIVSSLSNPSAWPPGWSWQRSPCWCTPCALFFPLSATAQRGRQRNGGEFGIRMEHSSFASEKGFCIQRVFVKIECTERIANSLEVKLSMQKISVVRASEKKKIISGWVM